MPYPEAYVLDKRGKFAEKVKDILVQNGAMYKEIAANGNAVDLKPSIEATAT